MKKVWAVELDLLAEAMRVMDKYSIKYYAIGGTLLGAARHRGYIPWDDDIDIAIPRLDYERFRIIARKEFSHPYFFQDEFNNPGLLCGHAKLRNSNTVMVFPNQIKEKGGSLSFNLGIFIDFFPIDNVPDDFDMKLRWRKGLKHVARNAWNLRNFTHRGVPAKVLKDSKMRLLFLRFLLFLKRDPDYFFKKYNHLLSRYSEVSTDKSCIYCLHCKDKSGKNRWIWDNISLVNKGMVYLPFEFLRLPCPSDYAAILTQTYGNWHEMRQVDSEHGNVKDTFYDVENSYLSFFNSEGYLDRDLLRLAMIDRH